MRLAPPADELRHPVLARDGGERLEGRVGSGRRRVALLFEGVALVSHLVRAGWRLEGGWSTARWGEGGLAAAARPGRELHPRRRVAELFERLFAARPGGGRPAGGGQAGRIARRLGRDLDQSLVFDDPDRWLGRLLDEARFLRRRRWSAALESVRGEHLRAGRAESWIAGPGWLRRRLRDVPGGSVARAVADGHEVAEPVGGPLERAGRQAARGRLRAALATLRGQGGDDEIELVRAECQLFLGEMVAADRRLARLERRGLDPETALRGLAVAAAVLGPRGRRRRLEGWIAAAERSADRVRFFVSAASARRAAGQIEEAWRLVESAAPGVSDPGPQDAGLAAAWHRCRGRLAADGGDLATAERELARALELSRRGLGRPRAARLWEELGEVRLRAGEVRSAGRALLHAYRLWQGCEGAGGRVRCLARLARVHLADGRHDGVEESVRALGAAVPRSCGLTLREVRLAEARCALGRGRAAEAAAACERAAAELARRAPGVDRSPLTLLAARSAAAAGDRRAAVERLAEAALPAEGGELAVEERIALWAELGEMARARRECARAGSPAGEVWRVVLSGRPVPPPAWRRLSEWSPVRAARVVLDIARFAAERVPDAELRRAAEALRRAGADEMAHDLEARRSGPWRSVRRYLEPGRRDGEALRRLFREAGYAAARLAWRGPEGDEEVLVPAAGGDEGRSAPLAGGRLVLSAPRVDPVLEALFALACRDARPTAAERGAPPAGGGIVGRSPALLAALDRLDRLAVEEMPLLLLGETGTGKELAARRAHAASPRRDGPFLPVNCAALSTTLLLSDLFGHARGAFTGADRDRSGVFESARGGTVFLDEVGDLPASAQGALLRVLQEGEIRRVGESRSRPVDVRVIAATHRDLEEMARCGDFRRDLLYRLGAGRVTLPPLAERGRDVLRLADHFLARAPADRRAILDRRARQRLVTYSWPGNVRELESVLTVASALAGDGPIGVEHLDLPAAPAEGDGSYHEQIAGLRRRLVEEALTAAGGNQARAARRLGLTRQALSYLVRRLGIA